MSRNAEDTSQTTRLFRCPSCGASLDVVDAPSVTCKYCGSHVPVPQELRPQRPQVIIQQAPDYTQQYVEATRAGGRAGLLITLVILLFVGGIVVFAVSSTQSAIDSVVSSVESVSNSGAPTPAPTPTPAFADVVLQFGGEGSGPGLFSDPRNIAVDKDGNIYVTDFDTGRVQKFDPAGKFAWLVTLQPDKNDRRRIDGVAADFAGHVYVTHNNDLVKLSAADGALLDTFPGSFPDTMYQGVIADANNTLYALHNTASDNDVIKLNSDGQILARWKNIVSSVNKDDSALDLHLAVDGLGQLYISSSFGDQVYVFDANGKFSDRFGPSGDAPGAIADPGAIAVDGRNRVYLDNSNRLDVYDSGGNYLARIPRDLNTGAIRDIATDIQGNIYLVTANGYVLKFKPAPKG